MSFFDESVTKNVKFALLLCYFIAGVLFMIGSQFIKENVNFKKGNETTEI